MRWLGSITDSVSWFSSSVVSDSATPWIAAHQTSLSITNSWNLPKPMSIESVSHPTASSSVIPFTSCFQSFPELGSFQRSQFFATDGQILEFQLQHQSFQWNSGLISFGLTGLIWWQSAGLSRVFSNTTVQNYQFIYAQFLNDPTLTFIHDYWKKP